MSYKKNMKIPITLKSVKRVLLLVLVCSIASCGITPSTHAVVSVADQEMAVFKKGELTAIFPISTSKFGLGDKRGSGFTPLGKMAVAKKIGAGAPQGAVFKSRRRTGEIVQPNSPGRDPIVTRILWLRGTQSKNRNAFSRYIYIHGTPEERTIGTPASYGCVRMKSADIVKLYRMLSVGSQVHVVRPSMRNRYN